MVTSGFFNSKEGDRLYDASEFGAIFDGVIADGVYMGIGNHFVVSPGDGMRVNVGSGRGWFNHTWILNTATLELNLDPAEVVYKRVDAVVIDVDSRDNYRTNSIQIVKGTKGTASTAPRPVLANEEYHHQYAIAYVNIKPGATSITQGDIDQVVGLSIERGGTPYVKGAVEEPITLDYLIDAWQVDWNEKLASQEEDFNKWFANIKTTFGSDPAGGLMNAIDKINEELTWTTKTITSSGWSSSTIATLGDNVPYYSYPITYTTLYSDVPTIDRAPTGNHKVQTVAEAQAFNKIMAPSGWVICDTDAKTITLYAKQKPSTTFAIRMQGVI